MVGSMNEIKTAKELQEVFKNLESVTLQEEYCHIILQHFKRNNYEIVVLENKLFLSNLISKELIGELELSQTSLKEIIEKVQESSNKLIDQVKSKIEDIESIQKSSKKLINYLESEIKSFESKKEDLDRLMSYLNELKIEYMNTTLLKEDLKELFVE